jgi:hypothetical protein
MSKKAIRSCTNTRWRNLTDNNKKPYLKQQTDDAAAKAHIFANNKHTHEQRKSTQYISNSNTLYDTHILQPLDSVGTPAADNNTCACTLETHGTTSTAATSDDQFISRPLPTSLIQTQPTTNNNEPTATHSNSTACVANLIKVGRGQRNFVADQRFGEIDLHGDYSQHCDDLYATLYGFSDGSVTSDHHMGSYSWLVCLRTPHRTIIVACGGGRISENDNLNAKITSARVEALGLLAGMHFAKRWKGRVEWKIDRTSVIINQSKLSLFPAREWMQQSNRDVLSKDILRKALY